MITTCLPTNYNFEIYKSLWRIEEINAKTVALQFPEGLLMYACIISDILQRFAKVETIIMGDVTYGACCVDDFTAKALGADLLIHYGHSCLVPIDTTSISMLYVFVDIAIDVEHFINTCVQNFSSDTKIAFSGTIQFINTFSFPSVQTALKQHFKQVTIPQTKPLSRGEVLGCTSARLTEDIDVLIFLSDGRFHLESIMIHNPQVKEYYKYDPYNKKLTREIYKYDDMKTLRLQAIEKSKQAKSWGIILGTLGRQGNLEIVQRIENILKAKNLPYVLVLLSEIFPNKLSLLHEVEAWVQIACPRLSIDWGYAFQTPLLSPYEFHVALNDVQWRDIYPMDYYSEDGGAWTNYFSKQEEKRRKKEEREKAKANGTYVSKLRSKKTAKAEETKKIEIAYAPEEA